MTWKPLNLPLKVTIKLAWFYNLAYLKYAQ